MILSFVLPFALVPLLRFTSSEAKMGPHKSSVLVRFLTLLFLQQGTFQQFHFTRPWINYHFMPYTNYYCIPIYPLSIRFFIFGP